MATYFQALGIRAIWNRKLSEQEMTALTVNPWQMFDPIPRTNWERVKLFFKRFIRGVKYGR